ncbi:MAG: rhodanese-like domain-containing protein, partial [Bacilli bacterium]|nr:rhodanese-like domain-containing protein [Bacilli bacterium]
YNSILNKIGDGKTKAYDLREYEECYAGRIPGFYCSRIEEIEDEEEALNRIVSNLSLLLGNKKSTLIILIDNDGENSKYVADKLFSLGYKNVHYFKSGYDKYVSLQDDFVPESGDCDC